MYCKHTKSSKIPKTKIDFALQGVPTCVYDHNEHNYSDTREVIRKTNSKYSTRYPVRTMTQRIASSSGSPPLPLRSRLQRASWPPSDVIMTYAWRHDIWVASWPPGVTPRNHAGDVTKPGWMSSFFSWSFAMMSWLVYSTFWRLRLLCLLSLCLHFFGYPSPSPSPTHHLYVDYLTFNLIIDFGACPLSLRDSRNYLRKEIEATLWYLDIY